MKLGWKITVGLAAVCAVCAFLLVRSDNSAQTDVEETRRALRDQGFKTELSQFNFSTSAEFRRRAAALTFAGPYLRRPPLPEGNPDLMVAVESNAARVIWQQTKLASYSGQDVWSALRESLDVNQAALDAACEAVLSGPIDFDLNASAGNAMLLPHLASLKNLIQMFANRAVLELHDGNKSTAWTNLLAASRLVTAYDPEPAEVSQLVRFACADIAYNTTWQTLQADGWADERLANLQREWESVDFFKGFPETAAFSRASAVAACQQERQQPLSSSVTLKEAIHSPQSAWYGFTEYRRRVHYRHHGTYEDEKALLLYYRERELQLRRAAQSSNWSEMRQLPGVTNVVPFVSKHSSAMQAMLNMRQLTLNWLMYSSSGQGQGLLGRAADAEARRRLIITAIALERFRGRHGSYPRTLQELTPELLKNLPIDFMDGKLLRYRLMDVGHFILYSVGLDCIDSGGTMERYARRRFPNERFDNVGNPMDLIWPLPASAAAVQTQEEEKEQAVLKRMAEAEKDMSLKRERTLAKLEQIYAKQQPRDAKEPAYQGRPLGKLLRNAQASGTAQLALDELLTVRHITTGKESAIATFEVPVSYDVVTNIGTLRLLVDAGPEGDSTAEGGELQACARARNGNCLLVWNTTYDSPGKHFLQAQLLCSERHENTLEVKGPLVPFYSSNLCQFDSFYSGFDSSGATLYAKLSESRGTYIIELKSPAGVHVRTFTGSTSNGLIDVHWDLTDDHGRAYTNDSVDSVFHVTLPDSGRSQTLKGP